MYWIQHKSNMNTDQHHKRIDPIEQPNQSTKRSDKHQRTPRARGTRELNFIIFSVEHQGLRLNFSVDRGSHKLIHKHQWR